MKKKQQRSRVRDRSCRDGARRLFARRAQDKAAPLQKIAHLFPVVIVPESRRFGIGLGFATGAQNAGDEPLVAENFTCLLAALEDSSSASGYVPCFQQWRDVNGAFRN